MTRPPRARSALALLLSVAAAGASVAAAGVGDGAPTPTLRARLLRSVTSPNTLASLVYLAYTSLTVHIEEEEQPAADAAYANVIDNVVPTFNVTADDDYYAYYAEYVAAILSSSYLPDLAVVNELWKASALLHLFNAIQYYFVWPLWRDPRTGERPFPFLPLTYHFFPEVCNVGEAALYTWSAFLYQDEVVYGPQAYVDPVTLRIHHIEIAAACLELVAAFAWVYVWWRNFPRTRGRGITLDDPEFSALVLLMISSFIYFAYNVKVEMDSKLYGDPDLSLVYSWGDRLYLAGAILYVLAALRDDAWFDSFWVFGECARRAGYRLAPERDPEEAAAAAPSGVAKVADAEEQPPLRAAASASAAASAASDAGSKAAHAPLVVRAVVAEQQ